MIAVQGIYLKPNRRFKDVHNRTYYIKPEDWFPKVRINLTFDDSFYFTQTTDLYNQYAPMFNVDFKYNENTKMYESFDNQLFGKHNGYWDCFLKLD